MSLLKAQYVLEELLSKYQLMPRIRQEFKECAEFNFRALLEEHEIPEKFGIEVLAQMALHRRCNLPTLIGTVRRHADSAQHAADLLIKCLNAGLMQWQDSLRMFIVNVTISDELQSMLDMYQYPLPMVVPPQELFENMQSAYLTTTNSVILRNNHHDDDVCLDHLNACNQIRFTINMDVVKFVRNKWRNLDKPKEGETSTDFEKRKRAFEKYDLSSREVIKRLTDISDSFFLTHRYDKRGRTYCQGYHVNYQGTPWNKACVEFAHKEVTK